MQHIQIDLEVLETLPNGTMRVIGVVTPGASTARPEIVQNLRLVSLSDTEVELAWDAAGLATGYKLLRDGVEIDDVATVTAIDATVDAGTTYVYSVLSYNANGDADQPSAGLTVNVPAAALPVPDPPANVDYSGPDTGRSARHIELSWDNPGNVVDWTIERDTVEVATVTAPLYRDENVAPDTEYTYSIVANNSAGSSDPTEFVARTLTNAPPEWTVATLPPGTVGEAYSLVLDDLSDDDDGDALTYALTAGALPPGLSLVGNQISGTPTAEGLFTPTIEADDGLDATAQEFSFSIAAAVDTTPPTAPVLGTPVVTGSSVSIPLLTPATDANGIERYTVSRRDSTTSGFAVRAILPGVESSFPYVETGLAPDTYEYRVSARDNSPNNNVSAFSNVVAAVIEATNPNPDAPINFVAQSSGATSNALSWQPGPSGPAVTDYDLDFTTNAGTGQGAAPWTPLAVGLQTSFSHTGLTAGVRVYYRLKAKSSGGESGYVFANAEPNQRTLYASATFSNGRIAATPTSRVATAAGAAARNNNGILIKAVAKVQGTGSKTAWANTGDGPSLFNAAEEGGAEAYDVHVCSGETVVLNGVSDTIAPREGGYFLRSRCYAGNNNNSTAQSPNAWAPNYTDEFKHYEGPNRNSTGDNAAHDGPICKPRTESALANRSAYGIPYDTRFFHGFSLYLHKDHEVVRKANGNKQAMNGSGPQLGEMNPATTGVSGSIMVFSLNIPDNDWINALDTQTPKRTIGQTVGTQTDHWWCLKLSVSATSDQENGAVSVALCPVGTGTGGASDRGKWTDFVIEMCMNPYTQATVDNGWNFRANTGLLRVWKSTGPYLGTGNGRNRSMNESLPYINGSQGGLIFERTGPVGLRPPLATPRDPKDMPSINIGGKHYCYMYRPEIPGGIDCTHGSYLGMAAMRQTYAENRQHSASNGAENSNMVAQYQGGVPGKWSDVVPRG